MIRFFDIFFSSLAILTLIPLFILVMLLLKFTGEGEVFFLQDRIGKNRKIFRLFKFVTMINNSSNLGTGTITIKDDPRVLPIGKFLRKTKINELPQLINVFLGNMSLIGPRPQTPRCFEAFPITAQDVLIKVKPGLSGIGSIIFRDENEILDLHNRALEFYDNVIGPYKADVEAWYVGKESLFSYFSIILITVWVIISPKSDIIWKVFKDLPAPPEDLKTDLNFPF